MLTPRMVIGLYRYRRFIWQRAILDVRHRYAGTGLGMVWNVLHPLAMIAVYSLVFSTVFTPAALPGVPGRFAYVLYLCSGFLPWLSFSECITRGANAFSENAAYLKKLPIPEQVFVAQAAASATLGLAISFSLLLTISLALGLRPTLYWLLLPIPLIAMQSLGFGLGLLCGTLNVFLRDVGQLLAVALQVLVWTVPIIYTIQQLPPWAQRLLHWHPVAPSLFAVRDLFLYRRAPEPWDWAAMLAWAAAAMLVSGLVFNHLRREIRDVL